MNPVLGKFITFEGGEGVGKSTQLRLVAKSLQENGIPCLTTREPGGTPLGESLRTLFLDLPEELESPHAGVTELLLILAARRCHLAQVILPALQKGIWVLCDRYIDSTVVYQGILKGYQPQWILDWHTRVGITLIPDLTVLLQRNTEETLAIRQQSPHLINRFDAKPPTFHLQVASAYRQLAAAYSPRFFSILGEDLPQPVCQKILFEIFENSCIMNA